MRDEIDSPGNWNAIAERCLTGEPATAAEALAVLRANDDQILDLLAAAFRLRLHHFGRDVQLHVLMNTASDPCSEDCAFCAQSHRAFTRSSPSARPTRGEMIEAAHRARDAGAFRFCMVATGRTPDPGRLDDVCEAVAEIRRTVGVRVCVSMGLLRDGEAEALRAAGADRYNHNLETGPDHFSKVCTSHRFEDRVRTIELAREAGLEVCSGGIVGLGEREEDLVAMAVELRRLGVVAVPVNILDPRPGTAFEQAPAQNPIHCLKVLCMFRLVLPDRDIRIAAGREACLRSLQPLALYPCNSMFIGGYLTTGGRGVADDRDMVQDLGFVVVQDGGSHAGNPRTGGESDHAE